MTLSDTYADDTVKKLAQVDLYKKPRLTCELFVQVFSCTEHNGALMHARNSL